MEIEKEFCPYELCKDLDVLGCKDAEFATYLEEDNLKMNIGMMNYPRSLYPKSIPAILWQQAVDFIREKYDFHLEIKSPDYKAHYWIYNYHTPYKFGVRIQGDACDSYYETRQKAIEKAIQIIKEKYFFIKENNKKLK